MNTAPENEIAIAQNIDKSKWGEVPWQQEPDRLEWKHAGLSCLALRRELGAWCGYVAIPPTHLMYAKPYEKVKVHGGLTYSEKCDGSVCHIPQAVGGNGRHIKRAAYSGSYILCFVSLLALKAPLQIY